MKRLFIIFFFILFLVPFSASAQRYGKGYYNARVEVIAGDSVPVFDMITVYCFRKPADMRKYARLVNNVKKVYPIAREASARLEQMELALLEISDSKAQKNYMKQLEKELQDEYTPILRKMTFSQGKVLIKLIDRETERTSYEIVREFRGGFRATFWQGIARIFGANLKDQYDKDGEDKIIEQIILLYEAGLI